MTRRAGLSRRQWAALAGPAALMRAQAPAPPEAPTTPNDELGQARERLRRASAELRKIKIDATVEPAFRFQV